MGKTCGASQSCSFLVLNLGNASWHMVTVRKETLHLSAFICRVVFSNFIIFGVILLAVFSFSIAKDAEPPPIYWSYRVVCPTKFREAAFNVLLLVAIIATDPLQLSYSCYVTKRCAPNEMCRLPGPIGMSRSSIHSYDVWGENSPNRDSRFGSIVNLISKNVGM